MRLAFVSPDNAALKKTQINRRRGFVRGVRSAEEQPEARMSRQDVGERTARARDGESGRSVGRRAGRRHPAQRGAEAAGRRDC